MKIFTSDEILANPECTQDNDQIKYQMTDGEMQWLDFVRGRYCIADYLLSVIDERNVVTLDYLEMSEALTADNGDWPKATMLSDDAALQAIIFYNFINTDFPE